MHSRSSLREKCLNSHVALVTGGASGIGKAIATELLRCGCNVAIISRNIDKLEKSAKELAKLNPEKKCIPIAADVRNYESIESAVKRIISEFSRIDILINCAAGNFLCSLNDLSYKGFKTVFEIDAGGTFIASKLVNEYAFSKQSVLPFSNGIRGIIINISMTLHYVGALYQTHAGAAKSAIDALTKHMAVEWGPSGIRVIGIAPGPIENTVGFEKLVSSSVGTKPKIEDFIPLKRLGTVKDIADICALMCLPESSYITGHTIVVDGGQWLTSGNYLMMIPDIRNIWNKSNL